MTNAEKKPFRRLPTEVIPYHYEITLTPDLQKFTFDGTEDVHIEVKTSTDTVVLNSLEIDVKSAIFKNARDGKESPANKIVFSADEETVTLVFPEKLPAGKAGRISLDFVGKIDDKMKGFYRSKYTGTDGNVAYTAVTQFEPTDARRCFPCWDEPAHKATFDITLNVTSGLVALSNMDDSPPWKTRPWTFQLGHINLRKFTLWDYFI